MEWISGVGNHKTCSMVGHFCWQYLSAGNITLISKFKRKNNKRQNCNNGKMWNCLIFKWEKSQKLWNHTQTSWRQGGLANNKSTTVSTVVRPTVTWHSICALIVYLLVSAVYVCVCSVYFDLSLPASVPPFYFWFYFKLELAAEA